MQKENVMVKMEEELKEKMRQRAKEKGLNMSGYIKLLITTDLENSKKENQ